MIVRTTKELERAAYVADDTATAELLARIDELEKENEEMEEKIADDSLSEWNHRNGDAEQYKDFFHDCFYRLNGYYPAPNISSDHDKSVIFEAIERGEGIAE
jgi:hypothetical protein